MSRPTLTVEIAFTTGPTDPNPVWVDVTTKVMSINIQRGRQYETDTIQPSTCTIRLDNGDRRFDPTYTQSPYYPNVLANKKIRVSAVWSGTTYRLFTGFVERWPIVWDALAWGSVTVTAVDGFAALQNAALVATPNMLTTSSVDGGFESGTTGWTVSNATLTQQTSGMQNGAGCGKVLGSASATNQAFPGGGAGALRLGMTAGNWYRFSAWIYVPSGLGTTLANVGAYFHSDTITAAGTFATVADTWQFHSFIVPVTTGATFAYFDVHINEAGAAKYFLVDGVHVEPVVSQGDPTQNTVTAQGAPPPTVDGSASTAGVRIGECLNTAGWNANGDRLLDLGTANIASATFAATDNQTVLSHVQEVAASEPGTFFINGSGQAVFQGKTHRYAATSKCTFTDAYGSSRLKYSDLQPAMDITRVANDVTATISGGNAQTVTDSSSQTNYFRRTAVLTPLLTADTDARQLAGFELALRKTPFLRFQQLSILPQGEDALWPQALGLELGDKVTVERSPRTTPSVASETILKGCFVEQISHTITHSDWQTSFQLSPSDLYDQFLVLGTGALGSSTTGALGL